MESWQRIWLINLLLPELTGPVITESCGEATNTLDNLSISCYLAVKMI